MEWISVKDRLPEEGKNVLFWFQSRVPRVIIGAFSPYKKMGGGRVPYIVDGSGGAIGKIKDVTHWMPLPDPPDRKEEGNTGLGWNEEIDKLQARLALAEKAIDWACDGYRASRFRNNDVFDGFRAEIRRLAKGEG